MEEKPIIKTEKLSVVYEMGRPSQANAVVDTNLEIYPGEFIIFFGPSGCGKSTLLYSIAGLEKNIQGDIIIDGKNLAKFDEKELDNHRQHTIGMIFQAYYLISSLSVLNNIVLPQFSLNAGNKEREKKAMDLLDFFGVTHQKDKYPNELSGGQQQRVAICRSLINDPSIILADEPTGNLDSKSATDVMNLLLELNEKKKKTVIVVTHSPGSLEYAHRVFHMKDGRIINTTVNRKRNEPVDRAILKADVLAKDLQETLATKGKEGGEADKKSPMVGQENAFLIGVKAQEIVTEALTGLSSREISNIESIVKKMISGSVNDSGYDLLKYLDDDAFKSGLGFDSRTANNMTKKIKEVVQEIKDLQKEEEEIKKQFSHNVDPEILSIRHYIFEEFDIKLNDHTAVVNFDNLIKERLKSNIDMKEVRATLHHHVKDGGVGIDKRLVNKITKRIELLILGKI